MAIQIQTSKGVVLISDEDSDLAEVSWNINNNGYVRRNKRNHGQIKVVFLHRVIFERIIGRKPGRWDICDHINGNKLDNRRPNLRLTNMAGNSQNLPSRSNRTSHGYRGVAFNKKSARWQAVVHKGDRYFYCGSFGDAESAAQAAQAKREELGFLGGAQ